MKQKATQVLKRLSGLFPHKLPTGTKAFLDFTDFILGTYGLPYDSTYEHAIATMIMHLGPTTSCKSPYYFAKSIRKAQANQVAYARIQEIKKQQEEKEKVVVPLDGPSIVPTEQIEIA